METLNVCASRTALGMFRASSKSQTHKFDASVAIPTLQFGHFFHGSNARGSDDPFASLCAWEPGSGYLARGWSGKRLRILSGDGKIGTTTPCVFGSLAIRVDVQSFQDHSSSQNWSQVRVRTTNIHVDYSGYVERTKQASSTGPISFFSPNSS